MKGKKAFGEVMSTLILFIAVIGVTAGLVIAMTNFASDTGESMQFQNELLNNQLRTAIDVSNLVNNQTEERVDIYVKNLGKTRLTTSEFTIFINQDFIVEFDTLKAGNLSEQLQLLTPGETVVLRVSNYSLGSQTNTIKVVSEFGGEGTSFSFNS